MINIGEFTGIQFLSNQGDTCVINEVTPLIKKVAGEILRGGKTADVANINGLSYPICRDYLHKFCRLANNVAYEELAVEAVGQGHNTPPKIMLQMNKHKFFNDQPVYRPLIEVELELATVSADCDNLKLSYRERNCARDQLRRELSDSQCVAGV